jgi:GGDEF domain-containing protein
MERDAAEAAAANLSEAVRRSGRAVGLGLEWSVGIAALRPSTVGAEDLMRVADIALYANKRAAPPEDVPTSESYSRTPTAWRASASVS